MRRSGSSIRRRGTHRGTRRARPAAARAAPLHRRHRSRAVRPAAHRRGPRTALAVLDQLVAAGVKMLVIACNTPARPACATPASATTCRWWRWCSPPSGGRGATTRNGRVGVIGTSRRSPAAPTRTPSPPHRTVDHQRRLPRFVDFVESGVTTGRLLGVGEYLAPLSRRRRHPRPRLHALPDAHRRDLLRHGRRGNARLQCRRTAKDVYRVLTAGPPPGRRRIARRAPLPGHR